MSDALLGTIIGGAITLVASTITFMLTARKERSVWERDKLLEAYSNAIFYLTAVMNWHYKQKIERGTELYQKYLADCNQADRWVQIFYVLYSRGLLTPPPEYHIIEEFVTKSLPEKVADAEEWSLEMAYDLLRNIRILGQDDRRLSTS